MNKLACELVCPLTKSPLIDKGGEYLESPEGRKYPIFKEGMYCLLPEEQITEDIWDKKIEAFTRRGTGHSWAYNHWHDLGLKNLIGDATGNNVLLNFGSGHVKEKEALTAMGYTVIALDIDPMDGVDVVADGHKLPFADNSFDTIVSFEVFEHVEHPWVVIKELYRVLKPQGRFVGSVAFLKPYHHSFFHMTHDGVTTLLNYGGFNVEQIYGGQNFLSTLVRFTYPLGSNKVSAKIYDFFFKVTVNLRGIIWGMKNGENPNVKMDRFDAQYDFTYKEWMIVRNAGCIIFKATKK